MTSMNLSRKEERALQAAGPVGALPSRDPLIGRPSGQIGQGPAPHGSDSRRAIQWSEGCRIDLPYRAVCGIDASGSVLSQQAPASQG
jgi:hypothetical protein